MANLSSLIHELRERIAASASAPSSSSSGEDPLETKFRTVLPNLLHAYVVPSSTGTGTSPPHLSPSSSLIVKLTTRSPAANEREVTAVLKLLSHTARNFPGVFYHGRAAAVLPVIVIFEATASLLSLLRTGDREAYRIFFLDAMVVVQAWTIRLVNKCLMEGTLYVEGLVNVSFAYAVCSLLCYGDATLHMVGQDDKEFVAFSAYIRIVKSCPLQIWETVNLVKMLCLPRSCVPLIECIRVAIDILCSNNVSEMKLFQDDDSIDTDSGSCSYLRYADLLELLKLPWTNNSVIAEACLVSKVKCLCIQAFSKIGIELKDESDLELLVLAMHDESEEVCSEAITSMPVIILCSGQIFLGSMLRKLE
ncbi:hypothetical protein BHM03_00025245 [Ensete ventricosum]|nr:hypothetical protein BHM03_00025245 [Ensete ventricosum]